MNARGKAGVVLVTWVALIVLIGLGVRRWQFRYATEVAPFRRELRLAWAPLYPYEFRRSVSGVQVPAGLDAELLGHALAEIGVRPIYVDLDVQGHRGDDGRLDALPMAFHDPEQAAKLTYSVPYFQVQYAAFWRSGGVAPPRTLAGLGQLLGSSGLRIGVLRGYSYPPLIQPLLKHPSTKLVYSRTEAENFHQLAFGGVDLIFSDEISGGAIVADHDWDRLVLAGVLDMPPQPVHVAFIKGAVPPELIAEFNSRLEAMERDGTTAEIVRSYYYPPLLNLVTRSALFQWMALLGALMAAVSGLLIAHREGYNLVGAFLLASAPAAGGGLLRDLIAGRHPVGIVDDPGMIVGIALLTLLAAAFFRLISPSLREGVEAMDLDHPAIVWFDTLGLGAFTVMGVAVALETGCEPLWLWGPLLAGSTAGGGAVLRDILRRCPDVPALRSSFYIEISILWAFGLSVFLVWYSGFHPHRVLHVTWALVLTVLGVILTRWAAYRFRWESPRC